MGEWDAYVQTIYRCDSLSQRAGYMKGLPPSRHGLEVQSPACGGAWYIIIKAKQQKLCLIAIGSHCARRTMFHIGA